MNIFGNEYMQELYSEAVATRKCLERVPFELFDWKPHERSMRMGDLATVIAEIPGWIVTIIKDDYIDFQNYEHWKPRDALDLLERFDRNLGQAAEALKDVSDEDLQGQFSLRTGDKILASSSKKESVMSSVSHLVHHRGQLTVYLRLCEIPVPSIYGPSADEKIWG